MFGLKLRKLLSSKCAAAVLVVVAAAPCMASGYLYVDNTGQPYKWPGDIVVRFDQGPLGRLSKSEADALTLSAMQAWMEPNVPGSNVHFVRGADLTEDHGDGAGTDPAWDPYAPHDGITPVIYDQNGDLLESILGAQVSASVVGATDIVVPTDQSPAPLTEGILIMNGAVIAPGTAGLPLDQYLGAIIHELGHLLNIGHSQASVAFTATGYDLGSPLAYVFDTPTYTPDYRGMPTMFPTVLPELQTLEADDIAWMKSIYGTSGGELLGSISGVITNFDGTPFDGANVVAHDVDDPTRVVTCVSGYSDASPTTNPSGEYKIPGLPPGTKWIVDVEPIAESFAGGSLVGSIDPPPPLAGMPEFVNEPGVESSSDQASLSTTFVITTGSIGLDVTDANLQFSDPDDIEIVEEQDLGVDEKTAQLIDATPGRMMFINGTIDPNEPGAQDIPLTGRYSDYYRVTAPAGLELNMMMINTYGSVLDLQLLHLQESADSPILTGTASGFGTNYLSLYVDSAHVGQGAHKGVYGIAVGLTNPFIGGSNPYEVTDYTVLLAFSVSDRDCVALGGTQSGTINPDSGTIRVTGRGFKDVGGSPVVTFDSPGIQVTDVTFIDENTLDVTIETGPGFLPGETTLQVMNRPESGGYGGRIRQMTIGTPSSVIGWEFY